MVRRQEAGSRARTRVLICDDAPDHRALVRAILDSEPDVEIVAEAYDGVSCLAAIAVTAPDVLVLDLHMPGTDGFDVLSALRGDANAPRIVVLSSAPADEVAARVREAGADYLRKGGALGELAEAIRRAAS